MASASETSSVTPTGGQSPQEKYPNVFKFVDEFNKEFDKFIESKKSVIEEAKLLLASASQIPDLKKISFPDGNTSVRTVGDLYKYVYNLEKAENLSPRVKRDGSGNVDSASVQLLFDFNNEMDGNNLTPKQNLKPIRSKIESGLFNLSKVNDALAKKEPRGPNPSLWSPGLLFFDIFIVEMQLYVSRPGEWDAVGAGFSSAYKTALQNGTETFKYAISSFTPDGNIVVKSSPIQQKNPDFKYSDGQAGYSVFYKLFREVYKFNKNSFDAIANIGINEIEYDQTIPFPGLRTQYLSGRLEELKNNPTFQLSRGIEEDEQGTIFQGNYEFISLYKAFKEAGDDYKPYTLEIPKIAKASVQEPPKEEKKDPPAEPPAGMSPSNTNEPIFTFDVQDDKTFYCKNPEIQYFVIKETNDVPNAIILREEIIDDLGDEELLDEEYIEVSFGGGKGNESIVRSEREFSENLTFYSNNRVDEGAIGAGQGSSNAGTSPSNPGLSPSNPGLSPSNPGLSPSNSSNGRPAASKYGLDYLPPNTTDKYGDLTSVPYYAQGDQRWSRQIYGQVTLETGVLAFIEDANFSKNYPVKNGNSQPRKTTYSISEEAHKRNWSNNIYGLISGSADVNGTTKKFEIQVHYEWSQAGPAGDLGFSTVNGGGCGITSFSMILNFWAKKKKDQSTALYVNPIKMAKMSCENDGRVGSFPNKYKAWPERACVGTAITKGFTQSIAENAGMLVNSINKTTAKKEIQEGRPVLWAVNQKGAKNGKGEYFPYPAHYMVIAGKGKLNGKDVFVVNDPGNPENRRCVYFDTWDDKANNTEIIVGSFWSVKPIKPDDFN